MIGWIRPLKQGVPVVPWYMLPVPVIGIGALAAHLIAKLARK